MRIQKVSIKNFRAFKDCTIEFGAYTSLVGSNGVGKSTLLAALNVFFGYQDGSVTDVKNLEEEDFFQKQTEEPIEIKVTFTELSSEAKQDLKHYVRGDQLIVTVRAIFNDGVAKVQQFGSRMVMNDFVSFFEAPKAGDKKNIYVQLQSSFPDLPKWTSATAAEETLNAYEQAHPEKLVEKESGAQFYGFSKGANLLEKHIQWVYVPAVKDAATEELESKNTAFTTLLDRAVRSKVDFGNQIENLRKETLDRYQKLMTAENDALGDLSTSLQKRLQDWGNPRATVSISWYQDPAKFKIDEPAARLKTGEQGFEGSLARIGHGLQRSYLISLLQELATLGDKNTSTLVLGIEEPELYQHPPQAKHLAQVLQELSDGNAQVLAATHSPYFVSGRGFENVRVIRRNGDDEAYSCTAEFDGLAKREAELTGTKPQPPKGLRARLDTTLQPALSEMLFTDKLVLVEGIEDQVVLTTWIYGSGLDREFRRRGISIVPVNGKAGLLRCCLLAEAMEIPTFLVFDGDANCSEGNRQEQSDYNNALFKWAGENKLQDFADDDFVGAKMAVWKDDIQKSVFTGIDGDELASAKTEAQALCGGVAKLKKNSLFLYELMCIAAERNWTLKSLDAVTSKICDDSW
ncbi:MAG: ATP-dependent endonuclease [Henriciella sp.]|nr:ATP-dependent endonuclease [Henriciella sp.]MBO6695698.1 ATP-dependent endonuclease [Henriciella sp.]